MLPALAAFFYLTACQPSETRQEAGGIPEAATPANPPAPVLPPDVVWLGYTSEETKLLSDADFGAPTILTIDPLSTIEVLDTTNFFFVKARINSKGQDVTGFIDKVYLSENLEMATLLHERRKRR